MIGLLLGLVLMMQGAPPNNQVEGFVVQADTVPPQTLSNARLELLGRGQPRVTRSDRTGQFAFGDLPAGVYTLSVTRDGYLRKDPAIRIDLRSNQAAKNLILRMEPAPSIEGTIRDPEGNTLFNVTVQALRLTFDSRGKRSLSLFSSTKTDDMGVFRLYWLDPGEYYLSATAPPVPAGNAPASVFVPTYFPGFVDVDDAKPIRLDRRDASGMDFSLIRQVPATLTGYLSSSTRGALANTNIAVASPLDGVGNSRYQGKSDPFGEFRIRGIPPGAYIVSSTAGEETGFVHVRIRFDRGGRGAADSERRVDLRIGPGTAVSGRLGNATQTPMDLRNVSVQLREIDEALPQPKPAVVAPNGTFVIPAVQPGSYTVSVNELPEDLYLKSAFSGEAEVLAQPLLVPNRSAGLMLEIGTDGGRIAGVVFDESNMPLPGAQVILLPEASLRLRLDRYRTAITDQDGRFFLRGIAPGEYSLSGWSRIEPNAHMDPEYMRPHESLLTPVRIVPGENPSIGLRALVADR